MDCKSCRENIPGYFRGLLSQAEQESWEHHLTSCPDCRREVAEEQKLTQFLDAWEIPAPRLGFETRLAKRLEEAKRPGGNWLERLLGGVHVRPAITGAMAAMFIAAVATTFWLINRNPLPAKPAELMMVQDMDMLKDLEVIQYLDLFENWEEIESLEVETEEQS